ncbi:hypothetical protein BJP40_00055 [Streptomyces sp. CC53]|nr:hypothetical protein BJP40_00055 [Streptomyces sp. CC53]
MCLLGGVLCLLGKLHRCGTYALGLTPCQRLGVVCRLLAGELLAQVRGFFNGGGGSFSGVVGLDLCRLSGGLGPLCLGPCLHGVTVCRCRLLVCRLDGGAGVQREPYAVTG